MGGIEMAKKFNIEDRIKDLSKILERI